MIWLGKESRAGAVIRAGAFGLMALGSFFTAVFTAPLHGGALADPRGVEQVAEGVYGNIISISGALVMLVVGWLVVRKSAPAELLSAKPLGWRARPRRWRRA